MILYDVGWLFIVKSPDILFVFIAKVMSIRMLYNIIVGIDVSSQFLSVSIFVLELGLF